MTSYFMPAEWEPHAATLLAWPHNHNDWPGKFGPIPWVYAEIIRYLTQHERVRLLVKNEKQKQHATEICERAGVNLDQVDMYIIPTNRVWLRDCGPIFVHKSSSPLKRGAEKAMLDFRFNAWAKYPDHKLDDKVPERLTPSLTLPPSGRGNTEVPSPACGGGLGRGLERIQPMHKGKRVVLEGGSIDVNGQGALLTTEECLLSDVQCRNPGFTRQDYEEVFATYLGIEHTIWLGNGITGDDTHGHVDDIARFVNPTTIVTVIEKDKTDPNYAPLQDNLKRLKAAKFTVVELPMPKPLIFEGQRLPASYANFLIANGIVLVPTFNDPTDRIVLSILAELFPTREVIGIHATDLVWGLGTIHCMSQQEPL